MPGSYENTVALKGIERQLNRIGNLMEAQEKKVQAVVVDPNNLGAVALWRAEVSNGITLLGFTDWLAWHESDAHEYTTPADVEEIGRAIQAVRRGFESLEEGVQSEGERDG